MHIKHPHQSVLPLVILMLLETLNAKIQKHKQLAAANRRWKQEPPERRLWH
jgi:hypothetical protein